MKEKKIGKRVIIMVASLNGMRTATSQLYIGLANEFAKKGYDTTIVASDIGYLTDYNTRYIKPKKTNRFRTRKACDQFTNYIEDKVEIWYPSRLDYKKRAHKVMDQVYNVNPDFIVDFTWESSIFSPQLINDFPIIMVPISGFVTSAINDIYIVRSKHQFDIMNKKYKCMDASKIRESPFEVKYLLEYNKKYTRKEFGLKEEDFILVTVGNRLDSEIDQKFLEIVEKILQQDKDLKWILIGKNINPQRFNHELIRQKQIVLLGYQKYLFSFYQICDVFLNPDRCGGGQSITLFINCKKPAIVVNSNTDSISSIGIENVLPYNYNALRNHITRLKTDEIYYEKTSNRIYAHSNSDDNTLKSLCLNIITAFMDISR